MRREFIHGCGPTCRGHLYIADRVGDEPEAEAIMSDGVERVLRYRNRFCAPGGYANGGSIRMALRAGAMDKRVGRADGVGGSTRWSGAFSGLGERLPSHVHASAV